MKSDRRILQVRKNTFDATAALVFGLNISLIHFALFIMTVFVVRYPNVDKAIEFDVAYSRNDQSLFEILDRAPMTLDINLESITCESTATKFRHMLVHMSVCHYVLVIINLFREMLTP